VSIVSSISCIRAVQRTRSATRSVDPELPPQRGDGPELEAADRAFLLPHRDGRLAGREAREEAERDGVALLRRQRLERRGDRVDVLSCQRDLVRARVPVVALADRIEVGMLAPRPYVIDDGLWPAGEPAPKGARAS
jgi:hypothetical protein